MFLFPMNIVRSILEKGNQARMSATKNCSNKGKSASVTNLLQRNAEHAAKNWVGFANKGAPRRFQSQGKMPIY
jgi:hypothetical protein